MEVIVRFPRSSAFSQVLLAVLLAFGCGDQDKEQEKSQTPKSSDLKEEDEDKGPSGRRGGGRGGRDRDSKGPGDDSGSEKAGDDGDDGEDGGGEGPAKRVPCEPPDGAPARPQSFEEVVKLLNALPHPVTIPCLLDVLERPFKLNATNSELSVQPAMGETSPRVFLFYGDLIVTFAIEGEGAKTVEFSHLYGDTSSVKGELPFPVTGELAATAIYEGVANSDGTGTRCASCHFQERVAPSPFPEGAFLSNALRPLVSQDVPLTLLWDELQSCDGARDLRCDILDAMFSGEVEAFEFPSDMPTLF